ncbi:glycosyltransferase [Paraclostridium bifermentans]|uniref:glycosyltransferase n=1 Tax=Paraclostridium bifermentans TaxID=1490 RepID=UPI001FF2B0EB|nr:glycosyltransferase [Paraclostridium bifermentans]UOW67242.1 glycosyltransferase [Paraclostridium bifermentans]
MEVLYLSSFRTKTRNDEIQQKSKIDLMNFQAQKFHKLIVEGLQSHGCKISTYSTCSILPRHSKVHYIKSETDFIDEVEYYNESILYIPIVQWIYSFIQSFFFTLRWCNKMKNKDKVIICDTVEIFQSYGSLLAGRLCKCKVVSIVTDLPWNLVGRGSSNRLKKVFIKLYSGITKFIINKYDMYILLTKAMNECVNIRKRPFMIMEGITDNRMKDVVNEIDRKYDKKVILFAGMLEEVHGIDMLVKAFSRVKVDDVELHIYGSGSSVDSIRYYEKIDNRIKYYGVVSNDKIINEEVKSTLLINPRITKNEFTKYSFPSKNMEYMVSGTPILTTKLPGMPKEYYEYIYLIEEETIEGLASTLEKTISISKNELHKKGYESKKFIMKNKNNIKQTARIISFINQDKIIGRY